MSTCFPSAWRKDAGAGEHSLREHKLPNTEKESKGRRSAAKMHDQQRERAPDSKTLSPPPSQSAQTRTTSHHQQQIQTTTTGGRPLAYKSLNCTTTDYEDMYTEPWIELSSSCSPAHPSSGERRKVHPILPKPPPKPKKPRAKNSKNGSDESYEPIDLAAQ